MESGNWFGRDGCKHYGEMMMNYELPKMKYSMQKGLISIIVPVYNTNEIYFRECLDSILAQTFTNWEAILVNDGSTSNVLLIIDEYTKKDSRFIVVHKQNEGTLLARKTGLENTKGEFIANIDHDDTYHPQFLEKMHAKIIETNSDFVWCEYTYKKRNGNKKSHIAADCEWSSNACENFIKLLSSKRGIGKSTWNKLIKRECYVKVYFPNVHILTEDVIQLSYIVYNSKTVAFVPESLYFYKNEIGLVSKAKFSLWVRSVVCVKKNFEYILDGTVPQSVKNTIYDEFGYGIICYFLLNKELRMEFKNEIEPLLPMFIKAEKKIDLKTCLFFASKGVEFPLKFREHIKNLIKRNLAKGRNEI
jgi:glycosyltransferase involved in cell wall biosynthesis